MKEKAVLRIALGGLMACTAALIQTVPVFLSEAFVLVTIFSAVPIFLISLIHPKTGLAVVLASFLLIVAFSAHEALLFLFTNGPAGFTLGCCSHYTGRVLLIVCVSAVVLSGCLGILNYLIGISVFGVAMPGTLAVQLLIIFVFSFSYSFLFYRLCRAVLKRINKFLTIFYE
jgi:hypothetical protein